MPASPENHASQSHVDYSEELYRDAHGIIVMCMRCRRTRITSPEGEKWELVQEHVELRPPNVSDGICNECAEEYYARLCDSHIRLLEPAKDASRRL